MDDGQFPCAKALHPAFAVDMLASQQCEVLYEMTNLQTQYVHNATLFQDNFLISRVKAFEK